MKRVILLQKSPFNTDRELLFKGNLSQILLRFKASLILGQLANYIIEYTDKVIMAC